MATKHLKYLMAALLVLVVGVLVVPAGRRWWIRRQWFDLREQQLAAIERLGQFPPEGLGRDVWENELVIPSNVWSNVTFTPEYSRITNDEMQSLKLELDRIVAETTCENSFESVDRVFLLMLNRSERTDFIKASRHFFREPYEAMKQNSRDTE